MRKFDVALSRIAVAGSVMVTCVIAATNPFGANRFSFENANHMGMGGGQIGIVLTFILASLAILDAFINDMLPDKYHFTFPLKIRHLIFFMLAASQMGLIYNNVIANNYDALLIKYAWDGFVSVVVVFADFSARHRRKTMKGTE